METHRLRNILLIFLVVAAVILIIYIISQYTRFSFLQWITIMGTIGSLTVSIVLAYLYLTMAETQYRQTEIIENQTKIMESDHEPIIEVLEFSVTEAKEVKNHEKGEIAPGLWEKGTTFELTLRNVGRGLAENIRLYITVYLEAEDGEILTGNEVGLYFPTLGLSSGETDYRVDMMQGSSANLPPNQDKTFEITTAPSYTSTMTDDIEPMTFGESLNALAFKPGTVFIEIGIKYGFAGLYEKGELVIAVQTHEDSRSTLSEAIMQGSPIPRTAQGIVELISNLP